MVRFFPMKEDQFTHIKIGDENMMVERFEYSHMRNRMREHLRLSIFVVVLVVIVGMCLSCEDKMAVNKTTDFTVEMRKSDDTSDVLYLGIDLPSSGCEEDAIFVINDVVYQSNSVLTVQKTELVFEDVNCDNFQSVTLRLPSNEHDDAVLCVMTEGGDELLYLAKGTDFNMLLEYLSQN